MTLKSAFLRKWNFEFTYRGFSHQTFIFWVQFQVRASPTVWNTIDIYNMYSVAIEKQKEETRFLVCNRGKFKQRGGYNCGIDFQYDGWSIDHNTVIAGNRNSNNDRDLLRRW